MDNDNQDEMPNAYGRTSAIGRSRRGKKSKKVMILVFVLIGAMIFTMGLLFTLSRIPSGSNEVEEPTISTSEAVGVDKNSFEADSDWFEEVRRKKAQEEAKAEAERRRLEEEEKRRLALEELNRKKQEEFNASRQPQTVTATAPVNNNTGERPMTRQERQMQGNIMVLATGSTNAGTNSGGGGYSDSYNAPRYQNGVARFRGESGLDFLLKHGSVIPCALYSQIISDYQGIVLCRTTQDVYSANGKTLLIEKGSLLTGDQSVELEPGKNRVFTTWSDIETPNGINVRIDSLGAGMLGASGNDAWIDYHFKERFGGAILLSFIDDGLTMAANSISEKNAEISIDSSTNTAKSMAEQALENSIGIKPTGYTQIGQRINIIVARDIDMSSVYDVRY